VACGERAEQLIDARDRMGSGAEAREGIAATREGEDQRQEQERGATRPIGGSGGAGLRQRALRA